MQGMIAMNCRAAVACQAWCRPPATLASSNLPPLHRWRPSLTAKPSSTPALVPEAQHAVQWRGNTKWRAAAADSNSGAGSGGQCVQPQQASSPAIDPAEFKRRAAAWMALPPAHQAWLEAHTQAVGGQFSSEQELEERVAKRRQLLEQLDSLPPAEQWRIAWAQLLPMDQAFLLREYGAAGQAELVTAVTASYEAVERTQRIDWLAKQHEFVQLLIVAGCTLKYQHDLDALSRMDSLMGRAGDGEQELYQELSPAKRLEIMTAAVVFTSLLAWTACLALHLDFSGGMSLSATSVQAAALGATAGLPLAALRLAGWALPESAMGPAKMAKYVRDAEVSLFQAYHWHPAYQSMFALGLAGTCYALGGQLSSVRSHPQQAPTPDCRWRRSSELWLAAHRWRLQHSTVSGASSGS